MKLLYLVLYINDALTKFSLANFYTFDAHTRRFRVNETCRLIVNLSHLVLAPILFALLLYLTTVLGGHVLLMSRKYDIQGTDSYRITGAIISLVKINTKILTQFYIWKLLWFRVEHLLELLNLFVTVYDQYRRLPGPRVPLRLKWSVFAILCCNFLGILYYTWHYHVSHTLQTFYKFRFVLIIVFAVLLSQTFFAHMLALLGVMLIHGFYRGAQQHVHRLKRRRFRVRCCPGDLESIVQFYSNLISLRADFESVVSVIINMDFLVLMLHLMTRLHEMYWFPHDIKNIVAFSYLLPIALLCNLSQDVAAVQRTLGNDLIYFDMHSGGKKSTSDVSEQLLNVFCLTKFVIDDNEESEWDVLHLQRPYLLMFVEFAWVNSIFINSMLQEFM